MIFLILILTNTATIINSIINPITNLYMIVTITTITMTISFITVTATIITIQLIMIP